MRLLYLLLMATLAAFGQDAAERKPDRTISILAERFSFNPAKVTLKQGELVELVLTSDDTDHATGLGGDDLLGTGGKLDAGLALIGVVANNGDVVAGGTAERTQGSEAGRDARSRSAAIGAMKWGNRPEGPCRAKGGTGSRNRWRER